MSADHGGIPQFRLCDDEGLVSAVTTPDKPPSLADLEALEQCFQRGLLRCDDVDGNDCSQVEVCGEYARPRRLRSVHVARGPRELVRQGQEGVRRGLRSYLV